jgi:hypothetical protein
LGFFEFLGGGLETEAGVEGGDEQQIGWMKELAIEKIRSRRKKGLEMDYGIEEIAEISSI